MPTDRIPVDRIPTPRELEQMYADQVAADYTRYMASLGRQPGASPGNLPEVDVMRPNRAPSPPPPTDSVEHPPKKYTDYCKHCGRRFEGPRMGLVRAWIARHTSKTHPQPKE